MPTLYRDQHQAQQDIITTFPIAICVGGILILALMHLAGLTWGGVFWEIERAFDLNREGNISTWYASMLWALLALFCFGCFTKASRYTGEKTFWKVLAIVAAYLSCDEAAQIHENANRIIINNISFVDLRFFGSSGTSWPILAAPLVAVLAYTVFQHAYRHLRYSPSALILMSLGAFVFIMSAMGLEVLSNFLPTKEAGMSEVFLEEIFEMLGVTIILTGVQNHYCRLVSSHQKIDAFGEPALKDMMISNSF